MKISTNESERGTGRTTQQMKEAPLGSVYIWVAHNSLWYAKALARAIGRHDLHIVGPMWLDGMHFLGRHLSGIVVDHATNLTDKQWDILRSARTRLR